MRRYYCFIWNVFIVCVAISIGSSVFAGMVDEENQSNVVCAAYITGIGCGNCAVVDPVLLTQLTSQQQNVVILEYEIYHAKKQNKDVKDAYFRTFLPFRKAGVPFLILNKEATGIGRLNAVKLIDTIKTLPSNPCPLPSGLAVDFNDLNFSQLQGKVTIWTKNRVLIAQTAGEKRGDSAVARRLLSEESVSGALKGVRFKKVEPVTIAISRGTINFEHAICFGDWILQWNGEPITVERSILAQIGYMIPIAVILVVFVLLFCFLFRIKRTDTKLRFCLEFSGKKKDVIVVCVTIVALVGFLVAAKNISPDFLEKTGYSLPLPLFTFLIALVDGFNPCNMFVLTCLLVLLISSSDSKKRLYTVALCFVGMVFVIYYLFMAAWLNVFKYISFITPLRVGIALIAVIAGIINCKELLFFRKGVTLMIQDEHKGPLMKRIYAMKQVIAGGSYPILITSSLGLAAFASLVELPCTAGFPIIYTGILSGKGLESTWTYYLYLGFYNIVYVVPLFAIVSVFIYTFRARRISQREMEIIKFIGGAIMILLGIILLANPGLIGLGAG